jgi:hypothetical protein
MESRHAERLRHFIHDFLNRPPTLERSPQAFVHRSRGIVIGVSMAWRRP